MIDLSLTIVFDGQKLEVDEIKASDLVALERTYHVSVPEMGGRFSFEHLCYLCWRVLRRHGTVSGEFDDDFLDRIENIEGKADPFGLGDDPSPD